MLNAFRHHRVLRNPPTCSPNTTAGVLNAFRHHRVLRIDPLLVFEEEFVCSTPFGIIGCYAANLQARLEDFGSVLNAFRHHRVLRDTGKGTP